MELYTAIELGAVIVAIVIGVILFLRIKIHDLQAKRVKPAEISTKVYENFGAGNGNLDRIRELNRALSEKDQMLSQAVAQVGAFSDHLPLIVGTLTSSGQIDFCNKEWEDVTGYTSGDITRNPDLYTFRPAKKSKIATGSPVTKASRQFFDHEIRTRAGKKVTIALAYSPLPDGGTIFAGYRKSASQKTVKNSPFIIEYTPNLSSKKLNADTQCD